MAKVHSLRSGYGSHKCSSCEVYSDFDSDKYYGLCPNCWANLGDDERAVLSGQLPLMEPVVTTYRIPTISFPRIYLAMLAAVYTPKAFALIIGWLSNTSLWHWLSRLLILAIAIFVLTGCHI